MAIGEALSGAREYLNESGIDGWLLEDYRGSNPILWNLIGNVGHVTRPCWFFVPSDGDPVLLTHEVDAGRYKASEAARFWFDRRHPNIWAPRKPSFIDGFFRALC